jgi:hypothetical protein
MLAVAWRNWEKPVKCPVALLVEPNCSTCRRELSVGCPDHWSVTDRNDLAHNEKHKGSKNWSTELLQTQPTTQAHALGTETCAVHFISDWNLSVWPPLAVECSSHSSSSLSKTITAQVTEHLSYRRSVHVVCTLKDRKYVTCWQSGSLSSPLLGVFAKQLRNAHVSFVMSVRLSPRLQGLEQLLLVEFSFNFIFWICSLLKFVGLCRFCLALHKIKAVLHATDDHCIQRSVYASTNLANCFEPNTIYIKEEINLFSSI